MAYEAVSFDPSTTASGTFNTNLPVNGKFVVFNESNIGLTLTFDDGSTQYSPAGIAMIFEQPTPSPNVSWTQKSVLSGSTPLSKVTIECYQPSEPIIGVYPMNVEHQTFVGNTVTTSQGSTLSIVNDGNASGTQLIESTASGSPGSNIIAQVQGLIEVLQWANGSLTQIFKTDPGASSVVKLGNTGLLTEVLGNLQVDQALSTSGKATLNSAEVSNTLKVDSTSEFVGNVTFDANPILSNAESLQAKDSGGTARTVLQVDSGNNTQLFGVTGTDKVQFLSSGGSLAALFDLVNKCLNLSTSSTVINGGSAGSATHWMPLQGSALKMVIVMENGFQTGASNQDYTFPTAFTNGAYFWTGSVVTWSFLNNGSVQSCNVVTALGTGTFQSTVTGYTFGNLAPTVPFNGIRHNSGAGSQHSGWIIIIGN